VARVFQAHRLADHAGGWPGPPIANEAIFFVSWRNNAVLFSPVFPALQQRGRCGFIMPAILADKTFNPSSRYPILDGYFILPDTCDHLCLRADQSPVLNRHLPQSSVRENSLAV